MKNSISHAVMSYIAIASLSVCALVLEYQHRNLMQAVYFNRGDSSHTLQNPK